MILSHLHATVFVPQVSHDGGVTWEPDHWLLLRRLVKVGFRAVFTACEVPRGLAKPGIASTPSTLLELALPLDEEGGRHRRSLLWQGGFQCGRGSQQAKRHVSHCISFHVIACKLA